MNVDRIHGQIATNGLATCNYVRRFAGGEAVAVDLCRRIVTAGTPSFRKYICDGTTIRDEVYGDSNCNAGTLITTETPTVAESKCDAVGVCTYLKVRYSSCTGSTYRVEPVVANNCMNYDFLNTYLIQCAPFQMNVWSTPNSCSTPTSTSTAYALTQGTCDATSKIRPIDPACLTIIYGPTAEPTAMPTKTPTPAPTDGAHHIQMFTVYTFVILVIGFMYFV